MSLADLIAIIRLLRIVGAAAPAILVTLRGPVLTIVLLAALLMSVLTAREGGVRPAVRLLLEKPRTADAMQVELRTVARRDEVLERLMEAVLAKAPTAGRVRLAVIHNGEVGLTGVGLLRFDITHATANPGYTVGPLVTNGPLSDWNAYLTKFLAAECVSSGLEDMASEERARMVDLGVSWRLGCPLMDIQGRLLGGLFITWPVGAALPDDAAMRALGDATKLVAAQIAAAMIATSGDMPLR